MNRSFEESEKTGVLHPALAEIFQVPGLENLAQKLKEKLSGDSDCEPKALTLQAKKVNEIWNFQRRKFLKAKVCDNACQQMLLEFEKKELENEPLSNEERGGMRNLRSALTNVELTDYINLIGPNENQSQPSHLLGLTKEDLNLRPLSADDKSYVIQKLEDKLFNECFEIVNQIEPQNEESLSTKEKFDKVQHLAEMIKTEVNTVKQFEVNAAKAEEEEMRANLNLLETMSKTVQIFEKLAIDFKMGQKSEREEVYSEYLAAKCKAVALKTKCLELEILVKTYNPDKVHALKKIRDHLKSKCLETQKAIETTRSSLVQYEAVGGKMQELVNEFSRIQSQIEGKKWALKELQEAET